VGQWPETLPGLNIQGALKQLADKRHLFLRLLQMFMDGHSHDVARIDVAVKDGDWQQAYEINHALKGVSGNIGATGLHELCCELDKRLKQDNHEVEGCLKDMHRAMEELLDSLQIALQLPADEL